MSYHKTFSRIVARGLVALSVLASTANASVNLGNYGVANSTYEWMDISSNGRKLLNSGDDTNVGPFPIGFDFPFYGRSFSSFRLCSNGFITFLDMASDATGFKNSPLPSSEAYPAMIALLWDDLYMDPASSAVFYKLIDSHTMVLQFKNVQFMDDKSKLFNAELILSSNGDIRMQYDNVGIKNSGTIGIQDFSKSNGVQAVYNSDYLKDKMGLTFRRLDNPPIAIVTNVNSVNVAEGGTGSMQVKLQSQPSTETRIDVSTYYSGYSQITSSSFLLFTPANWNQFQTVQLTMGEDPNSTNDRSFIRLSGKGVMAKSVTVQEIDNDMAVVIGNTPSIPEGGTASLLVKLNLQPQFETIVNAAFLSGDSDIAIAGNSFLSFNGANWNIYQPLTLSAAIDPDAVNGKAVIRCSGTGIIGKDATVYEKESDITILTNVLTGTVPEGGSSLLQVKLSAQPATKMNVNLDFLRGDSDLSVVEGSLISFTPENWNDFQTVKFSASEDSDSLNGFAFFQFSGLGLLNKDTKVVEIDNEVQSILVKNQVVPVAEGGYGTLWVKLNKAPVANTSVTITKLGGGDKDIWGGETLVFTAADYNIYKPVAISALPDSDLINGSATFSCAASGVVNVFLIATEVEKLTPVAPSVSDTTYGLFSSNYEWQDISATGKKIMSSGDDISSVQIPIGFDFTFYRENYSSFRACSNGYITFSDMLNMDKAYVNSSLPNVSAPHSMIALFWDDLFIDPVSSGIYYQLLDSDTMVLQYNNVQFNSDKSKLLNAQLILSSNGDIKMQYKNVGINNSGSIGIQDFFRANGLQLLYNSDAEGMQSVVSSASIADEMAFVLRRRDNLPLIIVSDINTVNIAEGGTASFQVKLQSPPLNDTRINLSKYYSSSLKIVGATSLIFTAANWNIYQNVSMTMGEDANSTNDRSYIRCSGPEVMTRNILIQEQDNDLAVVIGNSPKIPEGGSSNLLVKLNLQPLSDTLVNCSFLSGDSDIYIGGTSALTFTSENWNTYQSVTLTAAADADSDHGSAIIRCSGSGVIGKDWTVYEKDSDITILTNVLTATVTEGQSSILQVKLSSQPVSNTLVNLVKTSGDASIYLSKNQSLAFTTENWNQYQNVEFSATEDSDTLSGFAWFSFSGLGLISKNAKVVEIDNDVQCILVDNQQVPVAEGGSGTLMVKLNEAPLSPLTISFTKLGGGDPDILGGPSLTFTAADYSVFKPVSFSAKVDYDKENGNATFVCSANGLTPIFIIVTEVEKPIIGANSLSQLDINSLSTIIGLDVTKTRVNNSNDDILCGTLFSKTAASETSGALFFEPGWNMISLPIAVDDSLVLANLAKVISGNAWGWNGNSYELANQIEAGKGYIAYVPERAKVEISGQWNPTTSIRLKSGWNLVSPVAAPGFPAQALPQSDSILYPILSLQDNQYQIAKSFEFGCGYWIYATKDLVLP